MWTEYAVAASEHAADDLIRAEALVARGVVFMWKHRSDLALPLFREALATVENKVGPDDLRVVDPLTSVAWALRVSGDPGQALELVRRAAAVNARTLGEEHPFTLNLLTEQGCTELELGKNAEALATLERALHGKERVYGPDHLAVAGTTNCIAPITRPRLISGTAIALRSARARTISRASSLTAGRVSRSSLMSG